MTLPLTGIHRFALTTGPFEEESLQAGSFLSPEAH
jgi:hypothetical protein